MFLGNVVSNEDNVKGVVAKVQLGEADAGIVYVSDVTARCRQGRWRASRFPTAANVIADYPVTLLRHSANPAAARAFLDLLLSPTGQAVLVRKRFPASAKRPADVEHPPRGVLLKIAMAAAVALLMVLLALPIVSLLLRVPPAQLWTYIQQPVVVAALKLSLITSVFATLAVVALGLPVAYLLAMRDFRGKRLGRSTGRVADRPAPHRRRRRPPRLLSVARDSPVACSASSACRAPVTTTLAVVIAQLFVATPFFISAVVAGLREVEPRYRDVAMTLRASMPMYTFWHVLLPIAMPSVLAGAAMSWARALGEFGATITFAGNLMGRTQTMPLAVYSALQSDLNSAVALAVVLIVFSFAILFVLRFAPWGPAIGGVHARRRGQ